MAKALHVYITDKGADTISVEHVFYADTEDEANKIRLAHLAGCSNYALAEAEGRVDEAIEDIAEHERPHPDDFEDDDEETIDVHGTVIDDDEP